MILEDRNLIKVIVKVITNSASDCDTIKVNSWLAENDENQRIFNSLKNIGYSGSYKTAETAKERIFLLTQEKILKKKQSQKLSLWRFIAAASVVVVIIASGLFLMKADFNNTELVLLETTARHGTTSKIVLDDGSTILLNSGSTLKYPAQFVKGQRMVSLSGEAFFDVAKDKKRPFIVDTHEGEIIVLGTKFNLKDFNNENKTIVTLQEGSISFQKKNAHNKKEQPIIMTPNQQIVYNKQKNTLVIHEVTSNLYSKWKSGAYYFDNESFTDIVQQLERGFNVKIRLHDASIGKEVFSGIFDKGEDIKQILDVFKRHKNFEYTIDRKEVTIIDNI